MIKNIVAIEREGFEVNVLTLMFEVPDENFDLRDAVRKAATDYCKTEEGRKTYDYNCSYFNWADFAMSVPNEFCEKYGFHKIDCDTSDIIVDWDEQLVNESEMEDDDWETEEMSAEITWRD